MKNMTDFTTDKQDLEQTEEEEDDDKDKIRCKKHLKKFTPNIIVNEVNKLLNTGERIVNPPIKSAVRLPAHELENLRLQHQQEKET